MTTAKQRTFLRLLQTVHDRHDMASFDAHVWRGDGREDLSVYADVPDGESDADVLTLRGDMPMGEVDPLMRAGYIEVSGAPSTNDMRIWLSPRGRAFIENEFREPPLPPPAQITAVIGDVANMAVTQHGQATIHDSPAPSLDRAQAQRQLVEFARRVKESDRPEPEKLDAQYTALQLSAELSKRDRQPARLRDLVSNLRIAAGAFGVPMLVKALDAVLSSEIGARQGDKEDEAL